jgi:hypothetical protein
MASRIPGATITLQRGAAHFGAMEILPNVLAQLKADSRQAHALSEGLRIESPQQPSVFA